MKKILLLSCSTGEGHNSAARAIREQIDGAGIESEIADPISFRGKRSQRFVSSCYNNMIKNTPSLFGLVYKAGLIYDSTGMPSPVYMANSSYAESLWEYIEEKGYEAVISTHIFGMEALTAVRRKLGKYIPSYGVLTDYTIIPFFGDSRLDGFFVPHETLKISLAEKGVPNDTIFVTGIPVAAKFRNRYEKSEARKLLGIPEQGKVYLVMSGGVGGGNLLGLCDELIKAVDDGSRIYVLTGRNEGIKRKIEEKYSDIPQITAVPFTNDVNIYMNGADVLLTKPGGLSSTEAAVANIPLVHINAIPGCESENVKFFENHGMSVSAKNVREAASAAVSLADDPASSENMLENQRRCIPRNAAEEIARHVLEERSAGICAAQ